ncbi:MAG: ribosome silencing factor [Silvanigrellaceae bacterium]|nr:ribosome silencing factor [Silvanigrellaceae bacterium]
MLAHSALSEHSSTSASGIEIDGRYFTHEEIVKVSLAVALEKKATRPTLLDLRSQGGFTEYFALVSAANPRQVYAIAEEVRTYMKKHLGLSPVSVDGLESNTWVLVDFGFFFLHIFQEPTRELYQLEQLWSKARLLSVTEEETNELLGFFKAVEV